MKSPVPLRIAGVAGAAGAGVGRLPGRRWRRARGGAGVVAAGAGGVARPGPWAPRPTAAGRGRGAGASWRRGAAAGADGSRAGVEPVTMPAARHWPERPGCHRAGSRRCGPCAARPGPAPEAPASARAPPASAMRSGTPGAEASGLRRGRRPVPGPGRITRAGMRARRLLHVDRLLLAADDLGLGLRRLRRRARRSACSGWEFRLPPGLTGSTLVGAGIGGDHQAACHRRCGVGRAEGHRRADADHADGDQRRRRSTGPCASGAARRSGRSSSGGSSPCVAACAGSGA